MSWWVDPDQLLALTRFLVTLDMRPVHILTGTPAGKKFEAALRETTKDVPCDVNIRLSGDMYLFHQLVKNDPVDLLIGNSYVKYITKDEDIPYIRHGFPIFDRIGHSYLPTVGYRGGIMLLEKILNALMDRQDRDATDINMELVM